MDNVDPHQPPHDELPTYDSLAAEQRQNPNSRFGRWASWVEKRANERFEGTTYDQKLQRHTRGWGQTTAHGHARASSSEAPPYTSIDQRVNHSESLPASVPYSYEDVPPKRLSAGQRVGQTHTSLHNFGSRFIPHSESPINCVLPIMDDRYLLFGTDEGLSVLDLLPGLHGGIATSPESYQSGPHTLTLGDAKPRKLWVGESIHQLRLLEVTDSADLEDGLGKKGTVLALVGVDTPGDEEKRKVVRMYSLGSLTSLVSFVVNQPAPYQPLNLGINASLQPAFQKKHRPAKSLTRGLRSLVISDHHHHHRNSHHGGRPHEWPPEPPSTRTNTGISIDDVASVVSSETTDTSRSWDVIDELPVRWATDYVPLAPTASRQALLDVSCFELHQTGGYDGRGSSLLAVASKSTMLLYEASRTERAFRFVRELYIPFPVTHMRFVQQDATPQLHARTSSRSFRNSSPEDHESKHPLLTSLQMPSEGPIHVGSGSITSLFVTFERRAAIIRIADAAVQEISLSDDPPCIIHKQRSNKRESMDGHPTLGWLPIITMDLPDISPTSIRMDIEDAKFNQLKSVGILTKGLRTHIIRSPIVNPMSATAPLVELRWAKQPTGISARLWHPSSSKNLLNRQGSVLQLIGFGKAGVEVIEVGIASLKAQGVRLKRGATLSPQRSDTFDLDGGPSSAGTTNSIPFTVTAPTPQISEPASMLSYPPRSRPSSFSNPNGNPVPHSPPSSQDKGKGKEKSLPPVPPPRLSDPFDVDVTRGHVDIGADASLLCRGGVWHDVMDTGRRRERRPSLGRSISSEPGDMSGEDEWTRKDREREACGVYACAMRMTGDYRVFYVGDYVDGDVDENTE